jgi:hypothetical protein
MADAFNLKNGRILILTEAPGGLYNSHQLKKIAELCESEMALVRATEDQRLGLFVKEEEAEKVSEKLRSIGLGLRHYQSGLSPVACVGELCPQYEQDALGSAMEITNHFAQLNQESPLKIGINGCARCCVPCHTFDISIVGDNSGYRMSIGGKNSQLPEMASFVADGIPRQELTGLVAKVVGLFKDHAEGEKSLGELIEKIGMAPFIQALSPYSQDAAGDGASPFDAPVAEDPAPVAEGDDDSLDLTGLEMDTAADAEESLEASDMAVDETQDDIPEDLGEKLEAEDLDDLVDLAGDEQPASGEEVALQDDMVTDDLTEDMTSLEMSDTPAKDEEDLTDLEDFALEGDLLESDIDVKEDQEKGKTGKGSLDIDPQSDLSDLSANDVLIDGDQELTFDADTLVEDTARKPEATASLAETEVPALADETAANMDLADLEDLGGADVEEQLEAEISRGIEEEEKLLPAHKENMHDHDERLGAIELVEGGGSLESSLGDLGDPEMIGSSDLADDLGDLTDEDLSILSAKGPTTDEFDDLPKEDNFEMAEAPHEPVGLDAVSEQAPAAPAPAPAAQTPVASSGSQATSGDFLFSEVQVGQNGALTIKFENGAWIEVPTMAQGASRTLNLGGQLVKITNDGPGCKIAVGDIELFYPKVKGAA